MKVHVIKETILTHTHGNMCAYHTTYMLYTSFSILVKMFYTLLIVSLVFTVCSNMHKRHRKEKNTHRPDKWDTKLPQGLEKSSPSPHNISKAYNIVIM